MVALSDSSEAASWQECWRRRLDLVLAVVLVGLVCWATGAVAQSGDQGAHVMPSQWGSAVPPGPKMNPDALYRSSIVKDVDVVLVPVTVSDDTGRPVTGLQKQNFIVYDAGAKQRLQYFSTEDAPVSVGILFDSSGSMSDKIDQAHKAIAEFLSTANPADEFFVIAFSDRPELVSDFDASPENVLSKLLFVVPKGQTALLDAIYLGLNKIAHSRNQRRALMVISDGGDNHSRYSEQEVKAIAREADTAIYAVGIHTAPRTQEEHLGFWLLDEIAEATGGLHFNVNNSQDLADAATKIGYALHNQYVLGYLPDHPRFDGKWHKLKVKLQPPQGRRHHDQVPSRC